MNKIKNLLSLCNDTGFIVASSHSLLEFFELDDVASCIRVYLEKGEDILRMQKNIDDYFNMNCLPFETRNWKTLNPTWSQISSLFNTQFSVSCFTHDSQALKYFETISNAF